MHYEGSMIRPPSEADSILLQVTVGCSHNACAFCGAYQEVRFRIKDEATIEADLAWASVHLRDQARLFLCDGDALAIPQVRLLDLLARIKVRLPWLTRIGSYVSARNLRAKSDADLAALRAAGLRIVYIGLESGDPGVLQAMHKDADPDEIVQAGRRLKAAGLTVSVTVILGLAGTAGGQAHAAATGRALSAMDPDQIGVLSLMLVPGTPLQAAQDAGRFDLPGPRAMLAELRTLLAHTDLSRGLFLANHASNYLPLTIRLPRHKAEALATIDAALAGRTALRPEAWRGL